MNDPNINTKPLPMEAFSACKCRKCGNVFAYHRAGCPNCVKPQLGFAWNLKHSDMEYGFFMPPDDKYVSCAELYLQGYRDDDEVNA